MVSCEWSLRVYLLSQLQLSQAQRVLVQIFESSSPAFPAGNFQQSTGFFQLFFCCWFLVFWRLFLCRMKATKHATPNSKLLWPIVKHCDRFHPGFRCLPGFKTKTFIERNPWNIRSLQSLPWSSCLWVCSFVLPAAAGSLGAMATVAWRSRGLPVQKWSQSRDGVCCPMLHPSDGWVMNDHHHIQYCNHIDEYCYVIPSL